MPGCTVLLVSPAWAGNMLLLLLQGLSGLHAMGRGMSDLKAENIRVQLAADDTVQKLTLLDFGGSACYKGKRSPF